MDIDEDKKEPEKDVEEEREEEKPVEKESVKEPKTEEIAEEAKEKHEDIIEEKPEPEEIAEEAKEKPEEIMEEKEHIEEKAEPEETGPEPVQEEKVEKKGFFARLRKEKKPRPEAKPEPELKPEIRLEKPKPEEKQWHKPRFKIRIGGSEWYDKNYKKLLYVSFAILAAFIVYMVIFNAVYGDIMHKDVSLTGGTIITAYTSKIVDIEELEISLEAKLGQTVSVRTLEDITTRRQIAIVVETQAELEPAESAIEELLGFELTSENSNIEMSGASLSQAFYRQLMTAIIIAFIFMAIVVFIIFRSFVPSLAVVIAALTDLIGALVIANLFGFKISTAGIAAFLMLIGYSVDTDIMLTTKVLKRRGEAVLNTRIKGAAKTGLMMTITSFCAVLSAFFIVQSPMLKQIFFILSAGLFVDMLSTWLGNASILKWYCVRKKIN